MLCYNLLTMTKFSRKKFDNSDAYYEAAAESKVNNPFHEFARTLASGGLRIAHGKLRMYVPPSVRDLKGRASVVAALHRSSSDIPDSVKITEEAGFHNTRPLAKEKYFENPFIAWVFQEWGAVAVDRKRPNLNGVNKFGAGALAAGNSLLVYTGGTRIKTWHKDGALTGLDTRVAEKPKATAAFLAIQNQVPLIPLAFAGLADNDERRPFFLGKPVVGVMGDPIMPELWTPDQDGAQRAAISQARSMSAELHTAQQAALDIAYIIRETL